MQSINGRELAATIRTRVQTDCRASNLTPGLAVLLVGDDPASHVYVSLKEKAAAEVGIRTDIRRLPTGVSDAELLAIIEAWNQDEEIDSILVQLPLPAGHDTDRIIKAIDPRKDVDGFHPDNAAALLAGHATHFPPVYLAILHLIGSTPLVMNGAKSVILANSDTFAKPLEHLLSRAGCSVTITSPLSLDRDIIQQASLIVVAVGRPGFVTRDLIQSGACIIDVGTNRLKDGRVVGDVDTENIQDIPGWISPVPGGVGPLTVAFLLQNTLLLAKQRRGLTV